jgi:sulfur-carrier protein
MSIRVKYLAAMRERMGRSDEAVESSGVDTVADVWARVSGDKPFPAGILVAVNMEYAGLDRPVRDGDEVAFLPPVTGG